MDPRLFPKSKQVSSKPESPIKKSTTQKKTMKTKGGTSSIEEKKPSKRSYQAERPKRLRPGNSAKLENGIYSGLPFISELILNGSINELSTGISFKLSSSVGTFLDRGKSSDWSQTFFLTFSFRKHGDYHFVEIYDPTNYDSLLNKIIFQTPSPILDQSNNIEFTQSKSSSSIRSCTFEQFDRLRPGNCASLVKGVYQGLPTIQELGEKSNFKINVEIGKFLLHQNDWKQALKNTINLSKPYRQPYYNVVILNREKYDIELGSLYFSAYNGRLPSNQPIQPISPLTDQVITTPIIIISDDTPPVQSENPPPPEENVYDVFEEFLMDNDCGDTYDDEFERYRPSF